MATTAVPNRDTLRRQRLFDDLAFALARTDRALIKDWSVRAASRLLLLGARRIGGLSRLAVSLARFGGQEFLGVFRALQAREVGAHFGRRTAATIDGALTVGKETRRFFIELGKALLRDPKGAAPKLLGALLGLQAGSGGADGNGGVPDLDLMLGIGWHRSPLTHTIIAGVVAEGLILALIDLAGAIHDRLPYDHDPLWDELAKLGRPFAESASLGLSVGIAWHLLVDATLQPGTYHDLPFSMPIEAHQTVLAMNGAAEGADAASRVKPLSGEIRVFEATATPTTGNRFVAGTARAARQVGRAVLGAALVAGRSFGKKK